MTASPPFNRPTDPRVVRLIGYLYQLKRDADRLSHARAALADLRRGLRDDPRDQLVVGKYVVPSLGEMKQPDEEWFYLTAALFASHPLRADGVSIGKAFRLIKDDSGSTEKRFLNLLAADPRQLRPLLRQAVALLAVSRRPVGLDWQMLLEHLLYWDHQEKPIQHQWARDFFYQKSADELGASTDIASDDTPQGDNENEN